MAQKIDTIDKALARLKRLSIMEIGTPSGDTRYRRGKAFPCPCLYVGCRATPEKLAIAARRTFTSWRAAGARADTADLMALAAACRAQFASERPHLRA